MLQAYLRMLTAGVRDQFDTGTHQAFGPRNSLRHDLAPATIREILTLYAPSPQAFGSIR